MSQSCTPSRPKSAAATKAVILESARRRFVQESYESVGLRDIAGDAGVDVALVSRYFGSKEDLFREVLGIGSKEDILPPGMAPGEIAAFLARLYMEYEVGEGNEPLERLLIMLRSASSPVASQLVRGAFDEILQPLAARLDGRTPELRASLSMAVWMGMTIVRTVMAAEPLSECDCGGDLDIEHRICQLFATALSESGLPDRAPA